MGNTLAAVNITGNELCNTLHGVPTTEHSATLTCSKTGRYSTLQKTDPGPWDLNEFSAEIAEIGAATTASEEQEKCEISVNFCYQRANFAKV